MPGKRYTKNTPNIIENDHQQVAKIRDADVIEDGSTKKLFFQWKRKFFFFPSPNATICIR